MYISKAGFHWKHDVDFAIERKDGYNGMQILLIQSKAKISVSGINYDVLPNTAVVINNSVPHALYADGEEYMDDWIRFQISQEERYTFEKYNIPLNVPLYLKDDNTLELMLQCCCRVFDNNYAETLQMQHNLLETALLYLSGIGREYCHAKPIPYEEELRMLRKEIYDNPGIERSSPQIAKKLNLSVGYLNKIYSDLFGTSYMKDVFSSRMEYAQTLLLTTDKPVNEIAELCGYNSSEHFSRYFKKYSCMSPLQYRNKGGKQK